MKKISILLYILLTTLAGMAQERLYTDKILGGSKQGIVGKTDDELDVTPTGQLSYSIAVPAVPGTGGMTPRLSVSYNSSTKDGLLGYGFDLTGLPVIHRQPSNRFNDSHVSAVDFSGSDHFAIDGMRLMPCTSDNMEFRTENDSYMKITATGDKNNPASFTARTKSGLIYEFSSLSTVLDSVQTHTLFWPVTKVSDSKGNHYTVKYTGSLASNDFRVSRIDYTGNADAGLEPYASLRVEYISKPYASTTYVHGEAVCKSKAVSAIKAYYGEKMVRRLVFGYRQTNRRYQLTSVREYAADGTSKNPTEFTWANVTDLKVKNVNYSTESGISKANLTVGDFNGDGKDDFVAWPQNSKAGWKTPRIYVSLGSFFNKAWEGSLQWPDDEIEQLVSGDFNGDGYCDFVVKRKHNSVYHNCDLYLTQLSGGVPKPVFQRCIISLSKDYTIQTVELNGDGCADIFLWLHDSKECQLISSREINVKGQVEPLSFTAVRYCERKWDRVEFGDFNGDGLTDVMNLDNEGNIIMYADGSSTMTGSTKSSWPTRKHYLEIGDFNGDGKSDLLLTGWEDNPNSGGWPNWCVSYSKGDGTFHKQYTTKPFETKDKTLFVADINGDGFDDVQAIDSKSSGSSMTQPQLYLCDGSGGFFMQSKGGNVYATDKWRFYMGDFNGDGKTDLLCTSDWNKSNWNGCQLYLMPEETDNLLTGIKDGLGNETGIDYRYLSDSSVYSRTHTSLPKYPLSNSGANWPVVYSVSTPDGIGGKAQTTYTYSDLTVHRAGRGLLCFRTFGKTQVSTSTTSVNTYEIATDRFAVALKSSEVKVKGKTVSKTENTNTLLRAGTDSYLRDVFTYIPTKTRQRTYEYSTGELLTDVTTEMQYDSYGNPLKSTEKSGDLTSITVNTYDNDTERWHLGRLRSATVTRSNPNGTITRKSTFDYDRVTGLLTKETCEPDNKEIGYSKSYRYNVFGNIRQSTVTPNSGAAGRTTSSTYDDRGRFIVSSTNPLGFTQTFNVDEVMGVALSSCDENGIVTQSEYDGFGNMEQTSTPISKSVRTVGWSSGMADAPANSRYFIFSHSTGSPWQLEFLDCLGRTIRTVTQSVGGKVVYCDETYDSKGQVVRTSEPYFKGDTPIWNQFTYDEAGRTVSTVTPDGSTTSVEYAGLTTITTDPLGNTTTRTVDLNGNQTSVMDALGTEVSYSYDPYGNCIEVVGPRTIVRMEYDVAGNRISLDDPDMGLSTDVYNSFGELVSHTDQYGKTQYRYDEGGRVVEERHPGMVFNTIYDTEWKGAVSESTIPSPNGFGYHYTYDSYGRPTSKSTIIQRTNFGMQMTYNSAGLLDTLVYPTGVKVKHTYDDCGILVSLADASTGNKLWELVDLDARGNIVKERFGNRRATVHIYDSLSGRPTRIHTAGVQSWDYAFDKVGNLTMRKDRNRNLTEIFSYDPLYRITEARKNGELTTAVTYDNAGNILSKSDVGNYSYVAGTNRLAAVSNCVRTPKIWDNIKYNSLGKIEVIESGNDRMEMMYGPDRELLCQVSESGARKRFRVGRFFDEDIHMRDVVNSNYVYANGRLVAVIKDLPVLLLPIIRYVHPDHLGSVQAYSDEKGRLVQELSYDAWGLRRNPDDWTPYESPSDVDAWTVRGFGGHEHIDLFEVVNMQGRVYDPVVGRFLSPDPYVQTPDFTQSLNRYAYCLNNPLSLTDPSGYSWFSRNWKAITSAIVGIAVSAITGGIGTPLAAAVIAGSAGGAACALTGALLTGANFGQIAKATFTGAVLGAAGGFLNYASADPNLLLSLMKHSFSQGCLEGVQGGNILHGMMMGAVSKAGGYGVDTYASGLGTVGALVANSALSGVIDELGGGKFANGAITGAFAYLFNEKLHKTSDNKITLTDDDLKAIYEAAVEIYSIFNKRNSTPLEFYEFIGGPLGDWAKQSPGSFTNTCAAKLSYALNSAGFPIPAKTPNTYEGNYNQFYFINAGDMSKYLKKTFKVDKKVYKVRDIPQGLIFQIINQGGVSGHVDVRYNCKSGSGSIYPSYDTYRYGVK